MHRSTRPPEILLGFAAGIVATIVIQQFLAWALHVVGLTGQNAFSMWPTLPLGVPSLVSRAFWGGVFGIALAWFGVRYVLGLHWLVATTLFTAAVRTVVDWFIAPMFYGQIWAGASADRLVIPLVLNVVWALGAAVLLAAFTLAMGTWGMSKTT
jgi:hypothetical protein